MKSKTSKSAILPVDIGAIRARAGDKVFARGEAYHRRGCVDIFALERNRALADVQGSENYHVELTWRGKSFGGSCSCPAFDDGGFCKHLVAVALSVLDGNAGADSAGDRIRAHLKAKGIDALVEMIVGIAERDSAFYRKLDGAATVATLAHGDDTTIETRLRKLIDTATRTGRFVEYAEAEGWAGGVNASLDALADLPLPERAGIALKLIEYAIDRIEAAIEYVDDSDGLCDELIERAGTLHLFAASAARPDPIAFARNLFAREMASDFESFAGAVRDYAEVLGDAGLDEYRRLATERWDALPALSAATRLQGDASDDYRRLQEILDYFAEAAGDTDARIALRAKDLSSPWNYLMLAEFCVSQGRVEDGLRVAEEGLRAYENYPDGRLADFAVGVLVKLGRKADADALLQRTFAKTPNLELYDRWRKLSGVSARDRAIELVEAEQARSSERFRYGLADLLIHILMRERRFDAAWTVAGQRGVALNVKQWLAATTEKTHPREAFDVYALRVDELVATGSNPAYEEAVKLVARMAALKSAEEYKAYVATLRARFERKRNFMKLLA